MTTRNQKKTNEGTTSENGSIVNMLTNPNDPTNLKEIQPRLNNTIDPAQAKDISSSTSPATAKDSDKDANPDDPANAKDTGVGGVKNKEQEKGSKEAKKKKSTEITSDKDSVVPEKLVSASYLETLGIKTHEPAKDDTKDDPEEERRQLIADKQITLNKAMKAAAEGNADEATFLFRMHSRMVIPSQIKESTTEKIVKKVIEIIEDDDEANKQAKRDFSSIEEDEQPFVENGVTFMPGYVPSVTTSLLTPYFDKNIKEFKGPMPLSIFDLNWQALADSYHAEKKVKTDDVKHNNYTGYPYPDDLTLTYGAWCINYRNFLKTFANPYGWHRFAKMGEVHRENVETIRETSGWMTALRYDVKIRDSVFRLKCSDGTTEGAPDIRKHRKDVEDICYADARRYNELAYRMENPYAKGGEREGWNPRNGEPKHLNQKQPHQTFKSAINSFNTSFASTSSSGRNGQMTRGGGRGGRSGYRGPPELFDPHFAEKKAAAVAATKSKNPTS